MKSLLTLLLSVCARAVVAVSPDLLEVLEVRSVCGADSTLKCTAQMEPGVRYSAVRWHKVGGAPSSGLGGLVSRDLPNGTTRWYPAVEREVVLLNASHSLFLPNVTCADGGLYTCRLAAPVGEQNRGGRVLLTVTGCPAAPSEISTAEAYMVIAATAVLMLALVIFCISYVCLKNSLRERNQTTTTAKETLLDAPLRPLEKKDLLLIYTLGPKLSKTPSMKHICV